MKKALSRLRIQEKLHLVMGRCLTSVTANAEVDCSRIRNETVVSVSWLPLNIALGCLASTIRLEKKQSV